MQSQQQVVRVSILDNWRTSWRGAAWSISTRVSMGERPGGSSLITDSAMSPYDTRLSVRGMGVACREQGVGKGSKNLWLPLGVGMVRHWHAYRLPLRLLVSGARHERANNYAARTCIWAHGRRLWTMHAG